MLNDNDVQITVKLQIMNVNRRKHMNYNLKTRLFTDITCNNETKYNKHIDKTITNDCKLANTQR